LNYKVGCKGCPQSKGMLGKIITRWMFLYKKNFIEKLDIVLVAPSKFIFDSAVNSEMLSGKKITLIHNGVNADIFKPAFSKSEIRKFLNIDNKFTLLYSALNPELDKNKGIDRLIAIINLIPSDVIKNMQLVMVGTFYDFGLPIETHYFGKIADDIALSVIYSSADITLNCSYFESFGQVALESLACGVPVVGYNSGGTADIVRNQKNGYLLYNNTEIASQIIEISKNNSLLSSLSINARNNVIDNFTIDSASKKYLKLYYENKN
jgi:glycosyltransferase involved in cell wall biosynthesis